MIIAITRVIARIVIPRTSLLLILIDVSWWNKFIQVLVFLFQLDYGFLCIFKKFEDAEMLVRYSTMYNN